MLFKPLAFVWQLGDLARVVPAVERKPLWLLPNLLSLDAPLIASAWLYVFAQTWRLYLPWTVYLALALAVWVIYVADRLLDVSMLQGTPDRLEPRHLFHQQHQKAFRIGLAVATIFSVLLVVTKMPIAIFKYLLFGGVLVAGFFGLSMISSQDSSEVAHTKNIMAGITFAFGTAVMAHLYRSEYGIYAMLVSGEFLCFAVLCILNISAINLWEHAQRSSDIEVRASDELALTLPLVLLGTVALAFALPDDRMSARPFFYAILTGSALLYILNRIRARFSMDALRVLADVALLVPILVFAAASKSQ